MSLSMWIILWVVVLAVAVILEFFTSVFVSIWFVVGSLVTLVVDFIIYFINKDFQFAWYFQATIFSLVSLLSLLFFRPFVVKKFGKNKVSTNVESLIGEEAKVLKKITKMDTGLVKVKGQEWTAITLKSEVLDVDEIVIVKSISGVKLEVEKK